jgi:hypothetical protein
MAVVMAAVVVAMVAVISVLMMTTMVFKLRLFSVVVALSESWNSVLSTSGAVKSLTNEYIAVVVGCWLLSR